MERDFFLTRHSIKPKGEDVEDEKYKGISKRGVALAKESTKDILTYIEKSPKNAVIFLGGVSDEVRTKSTADVYGKELKDLLKNSPNYLVITSEDVKGRSYDKVADQIKTVIDSYPDKKIIIDVPFFMKEFSLKQKGWFTAEGKPSPYLMKLLEKGDGNEEKAMKYWFDSGGHLEGHKGPTPLQVAKDYEQGMNRLDDFAKTQFKNRPYVTGIVGHSLEADAFLTYLAGSGQIDSNIYNQMSSGKGMIKETELATVKVNPNVTTVSYRGEETKSQTLESIMKLIVLLGLFGVLLFPSKITGNVIGATKANYFGLVSLFLMIIAAITLLLKRKRKIFNYFILNN